MVRKDGKGKRREADGSELWQEKNHRKSDGLNSHPHYKRYIALRQGFGPAVEDQKFGWIMKPEKGALFLVFHGGSNPPLAQILHKGGLGAIVTQDAEQSSVCESSSIRCCKFVHM